ncbi:EF-hand domain-containing protein [bacterium]|nr:EF-hand domain-containing protein [bacterium]
MSTSVFSKLTFVVLLIVSFWVGRLWEQRHSPSISTTTSTTQPINPVALPSVQSESVPLEVLTLVETPPIEEKPQKECYPPPPAPGDWAWNQFVLLDRNGDCVVTLDEHLDHIEFARLDRDENGSVSLVEVEFEVFVTHIDHNLDDEVSSGELGTSWQPADAAAFVAVVDIDLDGRISFDEYRFRLEILREGDSRYWTLAHAQEDVFFERHGLGNQGVHVAQIRFSLASSLDSDGNGVLSRHEYRGRLAQSWDIAEPLRTLDRWMARDEFLEAGVGGWIFIPMDRNGDGGVERSEVRDYIARKISGHGKLPEVGLFLLFDSNHSGFLEFEEFQPDSLDWLLGFDVDGNGILSWGESELFLTPWARKDAIEWGKDFGSFFPSLDGDGNGTLSRIESGLNNPFFDSVDENEDGELSLSEIAAANKNDY